jgi:hypothetical protein
MTIDHLMSNSGNNFFIFHVSKPLSKKVKKGKAIPVTGREGR